MGTKRVAGQHARAQARVLSKVEMWIGIGGVSALLVGWLLRVPSEALILFELAAIAALVVVGRRVDRDFGRWLRGAEGEEAVGELLDGLAADGWLVIHDVSFGRGNIDHVVIGPGGVFTVETKSHAGRISLDRLDPKMVAQAYAEKKSLETITGIKVQALLVFSRAYLIGRVPAKRRGVTVVPAKMLPWFFSRRRPTMSPQEAREIHDRLAPAVGQGVPVPSEPSIPA
ncbi:MAG TPA: nuclease-related domain-containing protein [Solirubrobacterales bacterium]|nr:nuclease-related domain-containing protein [Solirubrobacterales bacterium]